MENNKTNVLQRYRCLSLCIVNQNVVKSEIDKNDVNAKSKHLTLDNLTRSIANVKWFSCL